MFTSIHMIFTPFLYNSQKYLFEKNFEKKKKCFLEAVNQLKKTSDCIKIDPPGPGQNLEKS